MEIQSPDDLFITEDSNILESLANDNYKLVKYSLSKEKIVETVKTVNSETNKVIETVGNDLDNKENINIIQEYAKKKEKIHTTKESIFRVQQMVKRVPRRSVMTRQNAMDVQDELEKGLLETDSEGSSSEKGSIEMGESTSSEDMSSVGGSSTEICSPKRHYSSEVEACVASDLSFCKKCDEGPDCCADASSHDSGSIISSTDEESDATEVPSVLEVENGRVSDDCMDNNDSWSFEDDAAADTSEQTRHNEQELLVEQCEQKDLEQQHARSEKDAEGNCGEDETSDEVEVITFCMGEGNSDKAIAEYEFFIDEDDDDYGEELEYDGDVRNVIFDDEEEYCVDDDYEEEVEEVNVQTRSSTSRQTRYSRYQEPLEVILEILGEEGEDESESKKNKRSGEFKEQKNSNEDLISFSSSGEFSPDSIEEYCARKNQVNLLNLIKGNSTIDSTIESLPSGPSSLTNDEIEVLLGKEGTSPMSSVEPFCEGQAASLEQQKEEPAQVPLGSLMDVPVPQIRLDPLTPQSQRREEASDRDKLKNLTSEIEAYLKETTQLLESAMLYTSSVSNRNVKTKSESDNQEVKQFSNTPSTPSIADNFNNRNFPSKNPDNRESRQVRLIEIDSSSFDANMTKAADCNVSEARKPPKEFHLHLLREEQIINLSTTVTDISTPVNSTNTLPLGLTSDLWYPEQPLITPPPMFVGHFNLSEPNQTNLEKDDTCVDAVTPPKGFSDNTEIFRTINETQNFTETEYHSALENSVEVMDALEWEEKKCSEPNTPRIIYKPSDSIQEDFVPFMSPRNEKRWSASSLDEGFNVSLEAYDNGGPMSLPIICSQKPLSPVKKSPSFEELLPENKRFVQTETEQKPKNKQFVQTETEQKPENKQFVQTETEQKPVKKVEFKSEQTTEEVKLRRKTPISEINLRNRASVDEVKLRKMSVVDDGKLKKRSSVDENKLRKRSSLRCESPPPTVDCLENLEKLCNRLSLEQEMLKENEIKFDVFRQIHTKKVDFSNCHDSGFESMVHQELDNSKQFHSNENINSNIYSPTKTQRGLDLSQPYNGWEVSKENQLPVTLKENGNYSEFEGLTMEDEEEFRYIDEKLDEIFRYVDEASKRSSFCSSVKDFDVTKLGNEETQTVISSVPKSKKNKVNCELQAKLNELFSDLDSMYERHVIKMKDLYAEQARSSQAFTPKGYLLPDKKEYVHIVQDEILQPQAMTIDKPAKENDPYQDILDVSEDLKNLCVFHANRTDWNDEGPLTSKAEGVIEENIPAYYDNVGLNVPLPSGLVCEDAVEAEERRKLCTINEGIHKPKGLICKDKDTPDKREMFMVRKEKNCDLESKDDDSVHVGILLRTLKTENQRCYEVTFRCLQKIVASTVANENISRLLEISPDAVYDVPRIHTQSRVRLDKQHVVSTID
ncbi:uncharacterized protein [Palaemon carinicauda]|uniref:uncharacterized protein n=1 Tax=Palaemon carinicauda TaxID=392227 RepID=UPI0035B678F9